MKDNFGLDIDPNDPQIGWRFSTYRQCGWYMKTFLEPKSEMTYWGTSWYGYEIIVIMRQDRDGKVYESMVPFTVKESMIGWLNG